MRAACRTRSSSQTTAPPTGHLNERLGVTGCGCCAPEAISGTARRQPRRRGCASPLPAHLQSRPAPCSEVRRPLARCRRPTRSVWGPGADDLRARRPALSQCSGAAVAAHRHRARRACVRVAGEPVVRGLSARPRGRPRAGSRVAVRIVPAGASIGLRGRRWVRPGVLHVLRGRRPVRPPREARLVMHVGSHGIGDARGGHRHRPTTAARCSRLITTVPTGIWRRATARR